VLGTFLNLNILKYLMQTHFNIAPN